MLNVMRENLKHLKIVLWAVAFSMVAYLGAFYSCGGRDTGPGGGWAALIDGRPIAETAFLNIARNIDGNYRQLLGDGYEQMKPNLRVGTQAIQALITQEIILADAERMGLSVSEEELNDAVSSHPALQGPAGYVGSEQAEQWLARTYPGGVNNFLANLGDDLLRRKWTDLMTQSVMVTDQELEEIHRRRTEKTSLDYVVVASADQEIDTDVDDSELRAWYDAHPDDYQRDPGRRLRYVIVDREALSAGIQVSEDEILASYEANKANYAHPAQRRARHILFSLPPGAAEAQKQEIRVKAEQALARVRGGEDFAALATTLSEDPGSAARGGDLDFFSRGAMVPAFDEAVFNTSVGELAPLTETPFGFHVIEVTDERAEGIRPLEQVRDEITRTLRTRRAEDQTAAETQRIKGLLDSAQDLDRVATAEGLTVEERFVTAEDRLMEIGASPQFMLAVMGLEVDAVSDPLPVARGMALAAVTEIREAERAPFEEVKADARTDILNDRVRKQARRVAREVWAATGTLSAARARLGLETRQSTDLAPGISPTGTGGMTDEMTAALFGDAVTLGDSGVVDVPGGAMIYEVTGREPFDPVAFADARGELLRELEENRRQLQAQAVIEKLYDRATVEINNELVGRIDG